MSTAELATSYAALILADDGVDITVRRTSMSLPRNTAKKYGNQLWRVPAHEVSDESLHGDRETEIGFVLFNI